MMKFARAHALGAAFALALAAPSVARAEVLGTGTVDESATTTTTAAVVSPAAFGNQVLSADTFNGLFDAETGVLASPFSFIGSPVSGTVRSQVFKGKDDSAVEGLYGYSYQVSSNAVPSLTSDADRMPYDFDGVAFRFNATPLATDLIGAGATRSYLVKGAVGGLSQPSLATDETFLAPANVAHQAIVDADGNPIAGSLTASFNPALMPDNTSATFLVLTREKPAGPVGVNLRSLDPTQSITQVYVTENGEIIPNPVPEPATLLAWAGMIGAVGVARRFRGKRPA